MPNLSIKDVPEAWAEILRQKAASNHRSLQGELMALIEAAVTSSGVPGATSRPEWPQPQGKSTVEEVLARIALIIPPGEARRQAASLPTGTDIIRAERDAR